MRNLTLWRSNNYPRRSAAVRERANADPTTRCRRCGLTLAQFRARYPGRRWHWQAGHIIDGDPRSPLAPEHAWCNERAGGVRGAHAQQRRREPRSPNA